MKSNLRPVYLVVLIRGARWRKDLSGLMEQLGKNLMSRVFWAVRKSSEWFASLSLQRPRNGGCSEPRRVQRVPLKLSVFFLSPRLVFIAFHRLIVSLLFRVCMLKLSVLLAKRNVSLL